MGIPRINSLSNLNSPRFESMDAIVNRKRMELQSKFSEIDVDGDGYITQEEVKNYLKKYGFYKCPVNCTGGKISFVEFTQWMTSDKPNILQKALNGKLSIPNFQGKII
ncbi:predicted protein [Naegleria gruberi]|uniref:Predicted protein n=1 Tax=Naegleria gruberi TaxID=5762 RepID=D2V2T8_NAEGR|nr:uncharacterized protein NAEGRDRAFT_63115 [Naegleria gruberi]EFC49117.1 predicted protein [Naegleria gruberi]|eukprot:XP_002681861.1 predicted protein [Naegleria gruberi strain NEG-M]